jgi:hypothetical protein
MRGIHNGLELARRTEGLKPWPSCASGLLASVI